MKDFTATNAEFESIDISEKFQISESGAIGGVIPSGVNDIIKWDGDKWIAGVNPGGSGNSGGSYVANPFSTNLISGQSIQGILFGQALDSAPSIATDLEIDGDGSIIPYTISGINTTGYTAIFAEEIPNNNYKIHTVFGGGGGGGGSSSSYWQTGASDLYYNDNNVNIQRDLTIGGNLTVNGTQTIVNTETVEIEDHNLVIGANTHYTGFANPYPGAGDAYAGILWGTGDAGAASSVGLTYQSNKGFTFEGGNVGIGTTDPNSSLHVKSEGIGSVIMLESDNDGSAYAPDLVLFRNSETPAVNDNIGEIKFRGRNDNETSIDYTMIRSRIVNPANGEENGELTFWTNKNNTLGQRMTIDSNGNVGIGTTDPDEMLHIFDSSSVPVLKIETVHNVGIPILEFKSAGYSQIKYTDENGQAQSRIDLADSGQISFSDISSGNTVERMRIDSNGNVGIGTTDPIRPLEVHTNSGAVYTDGASGNILRLRNMKEDTAKSHCGIDLFAGISTSTTTPHNPLARIYAVRENDADGKCALTFATRSTSSVSEVMRIDSAGNVGIGATNPSEKLHIEDASSNVRINLISSAAHDSAILFGDTGDSVEAGILYRPEVQKLFIRGYNNLDRMTIASDGKVGIGTTSPDFNLSVVSDTDPAKIGIHGDGSFSDGTVAAQLLFLGKDSNGNNRNLGYIQVREHAHALGTGSMEFFTRISGTENARMTIDSAGNVGIGTTDPGIYKLLVNNNTTSSRIKISSSNTAIASLLFGEDAGGSGTPAWLNRYGSSHETKPSKVELGAVGSGSWISIQGDGTDILNVRGSGNVGIGTTNPGAKLEIGQSDGSNGITLNYIPTTYPNRYKSDLYHDGVGNLKIESWAGSATTAGDILLAPNGGNVGIGTTNPVSGFDAYKLFVNGRMYVESTVKLNSLTANADVQTNAAKELTTSSDKRLKNDLGDCEYGLNEVLQVQPKKYTWKEGSEDQQPTIGFFAQDVHPIMPEAAPREAIQNEKGEDDYNWGFHSQTIIAALVNATKEQQQLIEQLKSQNESLAARISALES